MSLMKLLWTTTSLSEAKDQPHRYKMRTSPLPTLGKITGPVVGRSFEVKDSGGTAVLEREPGSESMKTEAAAGELASAAPIDAFPGGRWSLRPNRVNPLKARTAPTAPVQGELSLEKVKPLRNDLSDSDLELVPKKAAQPEPLRAAGGEEMAVQRQPIWARALSLFRRRS
jgi:hypothetical protein